jgi:hyperosmotically inducible periplasmic protein
MRGQQRQESMMKSVMFSLIVGLAGLGVVAPPASAGLAASQAAGVKAAEHSLSEQIEDRLEQDSLLKKHDIKVSVDRDVATLTGTVASDSERTRAGKLAKIKGIGKVDNQIVVERANARADDGSVVDKAKRGVATAGEKTKEGLEKAGEKTKEGVEKAGDETTDAWILGAVKTRFAAEDLLKGSDINVDSDNQVVTLKGTVPSEAARAKAMTIAKNTKGVHRVVDRLLIVPKQ